jgi:hypothetical protein
MCDGDRGPGKGPPPNAFFQDVEGGGESDILTVEGVAQRKAWIFPVQGAS